jgi:hypothetical protein
MFVSLMLSAVAIPAMALDIKQETENLAVAYETCVAKHDPACVAALYTKDGVQINPDGATNDIKRRYEAHFKGGSDRVVIKLKNFTPINNDSAIGEGDAVVTVKTDNGEKTVNLLWGDWFVRENGQLKIRLSVVVPKAEPPKEASADKK